MRTIDGMIRVIEKMQMLNTARLKELLSTPYILTPDEAAEHDDRIRERDWLLKIKSELLAKALNDGIDNFQDDMERRFSEILENIRKSGAGISTRKEPYRPVVTGTKKQRPRSPFEKPKMTEEDKEFLGSCGIKKEIW